MHANSSQSKTLRQAMKEYTRRYKRPPPKGFSAWWQYCQDNNVKIVDDVSSEVGDADPSTTKSTETLLHILPSPPRLSALVSKN